MLQHARSGRAQWRNRLERIIFGVDTAAGRTFDAVLLALILASTFVVLLESDPGLRLEHGLILRSAEWFFTALFTVEYALRIVSSRRPAR
jgi:voltage-gated potassium channel